MSKLGSSNKSARVVKALRKAGFVVQPGSKHALILNRDGQLISTVPRHRDLNVNTLRAILKQCGLSEARFLELY